MMARAWAEDQVCGMLTFGNGVGFIIVSIEVEPGISDRVVLEKR